jgi:hypothetical protein
MENLNQNDFIENPGQYNTYSVVVNDKFLFPKKELLKA